MDIPGSTWIYCVKFCPVTTPSIFDSFLKANKLAIILDTNASEIKGLDKTVWLYLVLPKTASKIDMNLLAKNIWPLAYK